MRLSVALVYVRWNRHSLLGFHWQNGWTSKIVSKWMRPRDKQLGEKHHATSLTSVFTRTRRAAGLGLIWWKTGYVSLLSLLSPPLFPSLFSGLALKLVSHQSRSAALLADSRVGIDGSIIWAGEHKKAVPPAVPSTAPRAAGALAFY